MLLRISYKGTLNGDPNESYTFVELSRINNGFDYAIKSAMRDAKRNRASGIILESKTIADTISDHEKSADMEKSAIGKFLFKAHEAKAREVIFERVTLDDIIKEIGEMERDKGFQECMNEIEEEKATGSGID